jgi:hypothetical protein
MKSFLQLTILFFSTICLTSCCKDEIDSIGQNDFLIFGHFYGECAGEGCIETYKLESNRLLEATVDQYAPAGDYNFDAFEVLPQQKFEAVRDLFDFFPDELLEDNRTVIGQPDAGDWGGVYVELKSGGVHRYWILDNWEANMPAVYNDFVDKVHERIAVINE